MNLLSITVNDLKAGNITIDKLLPGILDFPSRGKRHSNHHGNGHKAGGAGGPGWSPRHSSSTNGSSLASARGNATNGPYVMIGNGNDADDDDHAYYYDDNGGNERGSDSDPHNSTPRYDGSENGNGNHNNSGGNSGAIPHSPLMNEMLNASGLPGQGVDITFNVMHWGAAAAAAARNHRRNKHAHHLHAAHEHPSVHHDDHHEKAAASATQQHYTAIAEQDRHASSTATVRQVAGSAKLQEMAIKFTPGPIYFLRWKVAAAALSGKSEGAGDDGDRESVGSVSVASDEVQGSETKQNDDDDDDAADMGVSNPLLKKVLNGASSHGGHPNAHAHTVGATNSNGNTVGGVTAAAGPSYASAMKKPKQPDSSSSSSARRAASGALVPAAPRPAQNRRVSMSLPPSASESGPSSSSIGANGLPMPSSPGNDKLMTSNPLASSSSSGAKDGSSGNNAASTYTDGRNSSVVMGADGEMRVLKSAMSQPKMKAKASFIHSQESHNTEGSNPFDETTRKPKKVASITWDNHVVAAGSRRGSQVNSKLDQVSTGGDNSSATGSQLHNITGLDMSDDEGRQGGGHSHAEKAKKAKSVDSGSSAGSSTVADALRKGITMRQRQMETSLVNLRRSLMGIFVFVGFMNIASLVITHVLYSTLQTYINNIADNGMRGVTLQSSYSEIQRLRMMADGELLTFDNATATKARLATALDELSVLHQELYSAVDENDADERGLYSIPSIVIRDLVPEGYYSPSNATTTNRTVNLMNLGLEFIAKARQVGTAVVINHCGRLSLNEFCSIH